MLQKIINRIKRERNIAKPILIFLMYVVIGYIAGTVLMKTFYQ